MKNAQIYELKNAIQRDYGNIAGMIVIKNKNIEFEYYQDGVRADDTIHIASVTKSIISILTGIALHKGAIKSIDQKVLDFFPDYRIKRGERRIQEITVKNLLTMTAPFKFRSEPYTKVYSSEDWTKAALDLLGGRGTIGEFQYTTVGLHILSGLLANATGQSVVDFANENLFEPLGIEKTWPLLLKSREEHLAFIKDGNAAGWVADPAGVSTAGWGLALTAVDMAKIGQLYLNQGQWNKKTLVDPEWIEASTREQSRWGGRPYGYLWWVIKGFESPCYAAIGDGGNIIFVYPEKKIVVAIASRFMPRAKDRIQLISERVLPSLGGDSSIRP